MQRREFLGTVAGFGVGAAVLVALATVTGGEAVLGALGRADLRLLALVAGTILAWLCLWGLGLRAVLEAVGSDVSAVDAVLVNAGAAFANHVTPFGQAGGEPATALLLSDVSGAPFERALAAITSFDVVNVVPSLTLAAVGIGYYASVAVLGATLRTVAAGLATVAVVAPLAAALAWRRRRGVERVLVGLLAPLARIGGRLLPRVAPPERAAVADRVAGFVGAIESVAADRRRLAVALACSAAGWLAQIVGLWLALRAVGATVPLYVPLFVVPLGTVGSAMPTPGGLGGIEPIQVGLLTATTAAAAATVTAAVLLFSVGGFLLTTSVGAAAVTLLQVRERRLGAG
ncbi:lysylphosphatidylglycerol synthase transmembrane domain-containing protein [Natronomonas marina]|uniref:lysylphosphatidylglycerol synthase transmembrane domain-containing protein n=1 Tax=Natronomonas marina TaxID=2961939 RepID=UPI0020C9D67E|nr:lysylphosphatidylglycerol synthase transmembrane domain-containing protein [Natronomonas marina]